VGAIADGILAYAEPLLEQTDGSVSQMNRAMGVAQICWNAALMPEAQRGTALDEMKAALKMTDEEFAEFRQHIVLPMIQRHREMFPGLHARSKQTYDTFTVRAAPTTKYPGTGRNARCPCGSGRKHKLCCGAPK
jgi:uncharacterized protein YecA (UPF0149 family)